MIKRKHFLFGGVVTMAGIACYLLWYEPLGALYMFLGAIAAAIFLELMATYEDEKKGIPESEWTGI